MEKMKWNLESMKLQRKLVRKYFPFFSDSLDLALKTLPIFFSEAHLCVTQAAACLPKYSIYKHI